MSKSHNGNIYQTCSLGLRVLASPPDMSIQVLLYLRAKSCKHNQGGGGTGIPNRGLGGVRIPEKKYSDIWALERELYLLASSDCWKALQWHNSFFSFMQKYI